MNEEKNIVTGSRLALVVVFLLAIAAPAIEYGLRLEWKLYDFLDRSTDTEENRYLAQAPDLPGHYAGFVQYPMRFEAFWNDNFGWRASAIRVNNFIYRHAFKDASQLSTLAGKEGWIYLENEDRILDYTRHVDPLPPERLDHYAHQLLDNSLRLREASIHYLFVISPNKHSIYPEYLPDYVTPAPSTRIDQLLDYISEHFPGQIDILDLRDPLLNKKSEGLLYEKTGTHWNGLGAFFAYQEIVRHLASSFPELKPLDLSHFTIKQELEGPFELSTMRGEYDRKELLPVLEPDSVVTRMRGALRRERIGDVQARNRSEEIRLPYRIENSSDSALPLKVLTFRDSFFTRIVSHWAVHFQESVYYWQTPLDFEVIESEKPNIVVQEMIERYMMNEDLSFQK